MGSETDAVLSAFDAVAARKWAEASLRTLRAHHEAIDAINVFPVADTDTGTNLMHTMDAAVANLTGESAGGLTGVLRPLATGALAGARGNSGVLLSQVLRGFADELAGLDAAGPIELRQALAAAARLAAAAMTDPVEGTMLTVLRAAAAVEGRGTDLMPFMAAMLAAAEDALAATTGQLAVLASAGVVDAGAQGLVLLLDELAAVVAGRTGRGAALLVTATARRPGRMPGAGSGGYDYEVMYRLADAAEQRAEELRTTLRGIGDCVSVVGDGGQRWTVHVHCDDIGAAIEAGIEAGRPHRITVARFADHQPRPAFPARRAVLVLVRGAELAELFTAEGAAALAAGEAGVPADDAVLRAITATGAASVTVLATEPEFAEVAARAVAAVADSGRDAVVVPTMSPVQGLAALAVHDPARRAVDDDVAMAEAAAATRWGVLAVAEEDALTWVGRCRRGDVLGMVDEEVVSIEPGPPEVEHARALLDRMLAVGGELVTVLLGRDAPEGWREELRSHVGDEHPEVDLACYRSGRRDAVLLIGVE
ncbi:MAG: DAK2 domain-containing protein [Sciscionella sp.]